MSGKPILAVLHERSSLVRVLRDVHTATVVTFSDGSSQKAIDQLLMGWRRMMAQLPFPPAVDERLVARFSAREMARSQCAVFDDVRVRSGRRAA